MSVLSGGKMINIVVAYAKNRVIGNKGRIPWKIKGEQQRFKELTTGNVVIMGRRSYEEIERPLPNRTTIVISASKNFDAENCMTAKSLDEALIMAEGKDIYISGGARLYEEALPLADKMYITEIDLEVEGDTYFPEFDEELFEKEINQYFEGDIPYTYVTYTRKFTLCGDNCLCCPRYLAKTDEALQKAAELWHKVGWRDHVVSNEEIKCTGCSSHKQCAYQLVDCIKEHEVDKCNQCPDYPCEKICSMLRRSDLYKAKCLDVCIEEEYRLLESAFFRKEENLGK